MENAPSKIEAGIAAGDLHKKYGKRVALDSITLNINGGEIVGLLGPNGAGKTTTLSILATALRPDRGWARICGHDVRTDAPQARRKLGLVPQSVALYPSLTALENLEFFGRMQGLDNEASEAAAARQLDAVGLTERAE